MGLTWALLHGLNSWRAGLGCSDSYWLLGCYATAAVDAAEKCHGRLPLTRVSSWRSRERRCSSVAPEQVQRELRVRFE